MTSTTNGAEGRLCTHVTVLWAEDYPLFDTRVSRGEPLALGSEGQPLFGNLREPWPLLDARGRVCVPAGAQRRWLRRERAGRAGAAEHTLDADGVGVQLHEGDTLEVQHAGFCVRLEATRCEDAPGRGLLGAPWDVAALWAVGGSFALHGLFLVMGWLLPPTASALSLDFDRAQLARARYLLTPTETIEPDPPPFMAEGNDGGESGAAAAGEEGKAGEPEATRTPRKRQAPRGPVAQNEPATAKTVANVGTLAVLSQVAAGIGAGVFDPTAIDPQAIYLAGGMTGEPGSTFGFNGLGMNHTGRGGGGTAGGTIGTGRLGTVGGAGAGGPGIGIGLPGKGGRNGGGPPKLRTHVDVVGSLSKEAIRRTIQRRRNEVRYCYEQGLRSRPDMGGRVSVFFLIRPDGSVGSSMVKDSTLSHTPTDDCIAKAVRRWSFPAPAGGGMVQVTYPFVLQSGP